jgi:hypothetical protein
MTTIDRTRIAAIHEAASRARSEYVYSLITRFFRLFSAAKPVLKTAAC